MKHSIATIIVGALMVSGMLLFCFSRDRRAAVAQELPPVKDDVCELFNCGGGVHTCMYVTYLLEGDEKDYLITYDCKED